MNNCNDIFNQILCSVLINSIVCTKYYYSDNELESKVCLWSPATTKGFFNPTLIAGRADLKSNTTTVLRIDSETASLHRALRKGCWWTLGESPVGVTAPPYFRGLGELEKGVQREFLTLRIDSERTQYIQTNTRMLTHELNFILLRYECKFKHLKFFDTPKEVIVIITLFSFGYCFSVDIPAQ